MATRQERIDALKKDWAENPRWKGITRPYTAEDVVSISGSVEVEYSLAKMVQTNFGTNYKHVLGLQV